MLDSQVDSEAGGPVKIQTIRIANTKKSLNQTHIIKKNDHTLQRSYRFIIRKFKNITGKIPLVKLS